MSQQGVTAAIPTTAANKQQRRQSANKASHSRSYPRGVGLDFRKLAGLTLFSYIDHHGALFVHFGLCVAVMDVIDLCYDCTVDC